MATSDADELFEKARALRAQLEEARSSGDQPAVDRLESELHHVGEAAAVASVDVQAAQEELNTRRIELARIYKRRRRSWFTRIFLGRGGVGSAERFGTDTMPSPSGRGPEADRSRTVNRINELEEQLIRADALHIKPLTPDTVLDWRL